MRPHPEAHPFYYKETPSQNSCALFPTTHLQNKTKSISPPGFVHFIYCELPTNKTKSTSYQSASFPTTQIRLKVQPRRDRPLYLRDLPTNKTKSTSPLGFVRFIYRDPPSNKTVPPRWDSSALFTAIHPQIRQYLPAGIRPLYLPRSTLK